MNFLLRFLYIRKALRLNISVRLFVRAVGILFATGVLHLVLFKFLENVTWNESLWQTWQTFTTVGYGNRPAETTAGRWTTVLFGTMGIAFLGVIISQAFDLKQDRRDRRRFGMMRNPIKDGVVIFNYPGEVRLQRIVREIRYIHKDMGFCIIDEKLSELPPKIAKLDKMAFVRGELLKEETYRRAALDQNDIVLVFPSEFSVTSSDGLTQLIVRKAAKFMRENARLVYVQVDPDNDWLFKNCQGTPVLESFEVLALVQEATDKFSSSLVEEMFLNTSGANPTTVVPKRIIGWTWFDFHSSAIRTGQKTGIPINPFGIVKNGEAYTCPPFDMVIEKGDYLSVIVHTGFDWDSFERQMIEERG